VFLAGTGSVGLAFTSDFLDPSFRTPDEVAGFLESPVLASLPKNGKVK
jgi:capsular polysaccharide biosynthesis protein